MTRKLNVIIVILIASILVTPFAAYALVSDEMPELNPQALGVSKLWDFATGGYVITSPVIVDLDKDGTNEIIFGSHNYKVYCLSHLGAEE
ncbi:MAG: hypothetical protein HZR80_01190 [Candidatus Heimdallarchaeota archaeon]